jgi:D-alanine--poly(phosphoribitol) ligase subunit 1
MKSLVLDKIAETVRKDPHRTAYKVNHESITYGELWEKANFNAQILARESRKPVIIRSSKKPETLIEIISCLIAGRAYVPVDSSLPGQRENEIMEAVGTDLDTEDLAYIMFTSGSTGKPKGVPISVKNLDNFVQWISCLKPLCEYTGCNVLNQARFSFDLSVADIYYSLCNGHTLIALDLDATGDYSGIYPLFCREKINIAVLTPTFIRLCLLEENFNSSNCPYLNCIYTCGELLDKKTVKKLFARFPSLQLINAYGPTEATSAVSGIMITEAMLNDEKPLPVGEMSTNAVEIVIDEGEIVLKGKSVSRGYLGGEKGGFFCKDGLQCYRTGDLGFIQDGLLYCTGRKDSQVKYKGYRIELMDIENNIKEIPGVQDCAVTASYTAEHTAKTIKAFVSTDAPDYDSAYIRNELEKKLPDYMMPRTIIILDSLPMNQNGKIDRKRLAEL